VSSAPIPISALLPTLSIAFLVSGCHVDLSGLNQLFSSDPTYLSLPGRRIGSGSYSDVSLVGTNASGAYVVAFDTSSGATPVLSIFPFAGGKGCRTGSATSYQPLDFGVRSTVPPILGFHERTADATLLHFTGLDCKESLEPIVDRNFPVNATFDDPPGYLSLDAHGNLIFSEPWKSRQTTIAENARGPHMFQDKLWAIEDGHLVVRDLHLDVVATFGTNVTEYDFTQSIVPRAAYIEGTCNPGEVPCAGDLYVVTTELDTPKKIDSNACGVVFPIRWGGLGVSYLSPCATRHLVAFGSVHGNDPGPGVSDQRFSVDDSLLGTADVDFLGNDAYVFYVKADDPKAFNGELWGGKLSGGTVRVADRPTRDSRAAPVVDKAGTAFRATVDYDDMTTHVGRLVTWMPGTPLVELATRVAQISGPVAIVNFDGTSGDLVGLHGTTVTKPLAHHTPKQRVLVDTPGIAVITDYDGKTGTLRVAPAGTMDFEKVATGVTTAELTTGSIAFLQSLPGIGYLHDFDANAHTGVLGARIIETGDTFDIGIRASEWSEYGWPEPGILYVTPEGDAAGIWFARLR
jgi:hypothetical protein